VSNLPHAFCAKARASAVDRVLAEGVERLRGELAAELQGRPPRDVRRQVLRYANVAAAMPDARTFSGNSIDEDDVHECLAKAWSIAAENLSRAGFSGQ
jgi:hypothetical protein